MNVPTSVVPCGGGDGELAARATRRRLTPTNANKRLPFRDCTRHATWQYIIVVFLPPSAPLVAAMDSPAKKKTTTAFATPKVRARTRADLPRTCPKM